MNHAIEKVADQPRIIAIETSSRNGSVGIAVGPVFLREERFAQGMGHAMELMPALRRLCNEAGWKPATIEQIYLSMGPGSFTGLRVAISVARAMAQAIGCKIVGVSTADVLAQNAPPDVRNLVVALDAKRSQIFGRRYARQGEMVRTMGPALVNPEMFVKETLRPMAILGEGVDYHRAALQAGAGADDSCVELDRELWIPSARAVHKLGWARAAAGDFDDPATLLPVYIRLAEAEEVWNHRHNINGPTPNSAT